MIRAVTSRATPSSPTRAPSSAKIGALRCSVQRTDPSRRIHLRTTAASSSSAVAAAKDCAVGDQGPIVRMDDLLPQRWVVEELSGAVPRDGLCGRAHILKDGLRRQPDAVEDVRTALDEETEPGPAVDRTTVEWPSRRQGADRQWSRETPGILAGTLRSGASQAYTKVTDLEERLPTKEAAATCR